MRNIAHAPKAGSQVGQILRIEFFFSGINIGVNRVREDVRSKAGKLVQGNLFQRDYFICIWNSSLLLGKIMLGSLLLSPTDMAPSSRPRFAQRRPDCNHNSDHRGFV